ncbi:Crp/Fnr family transcriptional regulator [Nostoc sp. CHAB 5844]|nr:Crp/Fnr family transcriptional regulator [Nostoc sp. CHAB 5844]
MQNSQENQAAKNFILDSLPQTEYAWLQPNLEEVELQRGDILYRIREPFTHVYFPTSGLLSLTNLTEMGEVVDVGVTGNEGMVGITILLDQDRTPWQVVVQKTGKAFRLSTENFINAVERSATLRQRVAAFTYLKMAQLSQAALCNRFHSAEERLCRWLLSMHDYTKTAEILLTRDILAQMIGAGRPKVSLVTGILQTAGLIHASRGKITILNREGMEEAACECYQIFKQELERYLAKKIENRG